MKKEYKFLSVDLKIINALMEFEKVGVKVKILRKYLNLKQSHIYKRLSMLESFGIVINDYPFWKANLNKINNIRKLKEGGFVYIDFEKKEIINIKKDSCYFCNHNKVLDEHHIRPRSEGGRNKKSNILIICPNCHTFLHRNKYHIEKREKEFLMLDKYQNIIMFPYESK